MRLTNHDLNEECKAKQTERFHTPIKDKKILWIRYNKNDQININIKPIVEKR
jgi:hypothetical protein